MEVASDVSGVDGLVQRVKAWTELWLRLLATGSRGIDPKGLWSHT